MDTLVKTVDARDSLTLAYESGYVAEKDYRKDIAVLNNLLRGVLPEIQL